MCRWCWDSPPSEEEIDEMYQWALEKAWVETGFSPDEWDYEQQRYELISKGVDPDGEELERSLP